MSDAFIWTSARVADALGVDGSGTAREYTGISTDTRATSTGQLFVALVGEKFDGHDFLPRAVDAGASGVITSREPEDVPADFQVFVVPDTLEALGRLATARRRALRPTVVAVTGTNGKTTTRRMLAAALGPGADESPGNFNNLVGVPLTMLGADAGARFWVLELASNQPGEIRRLGVVCEPDIGVITSVGEGHLEGLGDMSGVLEEKLLLLDALRDGGHAFVADMPPELASAARGLMRNVTSVGIGPEADERADSWSLSGSGASWSWRGEEFSVAGFGTHLIRNGMIAAVVAATLGVEPARAAERMRSAAIPPMRGELRRVGELTLLVDCYNANPASFAAAIESLSVLASARQRAVLAGTMLELGARSRELHAQVATAMLESGIEHVALTGEFAGVADALPADYRSRLIYATEVERAYEGLANRLKGDEVVLLKASRGVKLERVIPMFERDFSGSREPND